MALPKARENPVEYRTYAAGLNVEARGEGEKPMIVGHAAVFDTVDGNDWFKEKIARGAFAESIEADDVRALFNHNPDFVLGRNKAGTLSMKEDDKGLWVEIDPPDTQYARDLMTSIERGDISQMSFGFEILEESREKGKGKEPDLFTLEKVRLWDVSPVTYPFYKQTDVSVHSRQAWSDSQRRAIQEFEGKGWRVKGLRRKLNLKAKGGK